ncbi:MAG TPA: M56 family metallopeptidase [Candidatus Eremiobacteraceae bacterium]|nr:M56 family metallopeptidase [Candidatus Eremiobacteraceae bacterium]
MFAVRGIAVSFSIFFLLYSALSIAVCGVWRNVRRSGRRYSATCSADLLFALRMAPFVVATAATFVFAVPSFLLLEPRAANESIGSLPAVMGVCGIAVVLAGMWNAVLALVRASRMVARWSIEASVIGSTAGGSQTLAQKILESKIPESKVSVSVMRIAAVAPPLTAVGIFRPTVWLSAAAEFVLNDRELQTALRHEAVHLRRRDNLRKLMLRFVAFPGMVELENAWREATEMAADDAAVSSASEALDLAAAVIKLSRMVPLEPPAELTTALVHSPAESVNARVERLIAWTEPSQIPADGYSSLHLCALCAAATVLATLTITYSQLLLLVHTATEWLVR